MVKSDNLDSYVKDHALLDALRSWGISSFTDVQIKAINFGLLDGANVVVSALTSSGKTLIAEMAMFKAVQTGWNVLYLVSHRALADQKFIDFDKRFGRTTVAPVCAVSLSTGDRSEGDADAQIRIATYEKAIGLIMSGQIVPDRTLIVADELQIICDSSRGPDIEALCAVFRQRKVKQFVALTATVQNPQDIAEWMNCALVQSSIRGTPLHQEIRYGIQVWSNTFGDSSISVRSDPLVPADLFKVVERLINDGLGPVLVFSETKREAAAWAADFIRSRPRSTLGMSLSDQLELFSEPTDSSEKLRQSVERCVAFHTADLSTQERQVLEEGFTKSHYEVCFATSTLAAGVNFPFRTIVFPKIFFQYRGVGEKLGLAEYRNMSGRAGRLGLHEDGHAIILPRTASELAHAMRLIGPENETLTSVLLSLSLRKTLLSLVASRIAQSSDAVAEFFRNTLYWHQNIRSGAKSEEYLKSLSLQAVDWLTANNLVVDKDGELWPTNLGRAAAISGLLPESAVEFYSILEKNRDALMLSTEDEADGIIYACCACKEYQAAHPSRFLPFVAQQAFGGLDFWRSRKLI